MAALETSTDPKVLAHTVKHFAFTRCGELNVYEMIDTQIGMLERELLAHVWMMLKQVESPAGESGLSAFPSELRPHVEVSPALISSVTDEVLDEVRTWQNRVLGLL